MTAEPLFDEREWIMRLRNRESGAWEAFIEQFRSLVHASIRRTAARRRMRLQPSDVEDLASEVFAAALESLERYRRECRLSTWLVAITRRVVSRELSRAWRVRVVRRDLEHEACGGRVGTEPLDDLLRDENSSRLKAALEQLPAACRRVFELHYVHELSYREISDRLGMSINSVGPALARGRSRLRELLRTERPPPSVGRPQKSGPPARKG